MPAGREQNYVYFFTPFWDVVKKILKRAVKSKSREVHLDKILEKMHCQESVENQIHSRSKNNGFLPKISK